jgi:predicted nucleic acid-binding Zn ribbon protein
LRDSVAAVSREFGLVDPDTFLALENLWRELVGDNLARHSSVRSLQRGECVVTVDGPQWATPIRYLERDLLDRSETRFGAGVVTSLRVVVEAP